MQRCLTLPTGKYMFKVIKKKIKEFCTKLAKVCNKDTVLHKKSCFPLKISLVNVNTPQNYKKFINDKLHFLCIN